jgi:hypothetical protein
MSQPGYCMVCLCATIETRLGQLQSKDCPETFYGILSVSLSMLWLPSFASSHLARPHFIEVSKNSI